ncbi:non-repetitive/WGA-negative nucleoporin carboxy-terminal protein [Rhizoctonia solani 123E]|uniref:Non-repetitive/WGA-negative nucleoporin carboxy-terminal protein n=1 Tax=Rhizoctonia solani 123E TaxID=1423351 RepID=A0A074STJ7_9AGAM|nr:non-repetitive/WGA-negative nucleoporin carboxy-terminal protein [Rhizoctonia solani 123E]
MALTRSVAMDLGLSQSALVGVGTGSGKSASASDIAALGKARAVVDAHLAKHTSRIPPLDETINASASTDYTLVPNEAWEQFYMRKAASLPDGLFEHIESAHNHSAMGLLPQINYAWIVLGNMLLLWDYANPSSELVRYDQQPNLITHVGLVKPKPGIFVDTIQHLLVLCTPLAVQIIGVEITPTEMKLYETDISISTDGVEMTSVVSSKLGRIFMLGVQDGCLYELTYQAAESWFTKKSALVNHSTSGYASFIPSITSLIMPKLDQRLLVLVSDPDRKCLYALTDRNHIIMHYLGQPEDSLRVVVDAKDLRGAAQSLCPSVALNSASFRICSLIVLPPSEASFAVLIATTTGGARLYFSHQRRGYGAYGAPSTLALIHVRPPPAQLPHPEQPYQNPLYGRDHLQGLPSAAVGGITRAAYRMGLLVAVQELESGPDNLRNSLFVATPDLGKIAASTTSGPSSNTTYGAARRPVLNEYASLVPTGTKIWDLAPVPHFGERDGTWNDLTAQLVEPPRQFIALTEAGLTSLVKKRPMDVLRDLIEASKKVGDLSYVSAFRDSYGVDQFCMMCFALLASNSNLSSDNRPLPGQRHTDGLDAAVNMLSKETLLVTQNLLQQFGGKPAAVERGMDVHYEFSARHDGFASYLAGLLKPIWKLNITMPGPAGRQLSNLSEGVLADIQNDLIKLRDFVTSHPQLLLVGSGEFTAARGGAEQEAFKTEHTSIAQLQALLSRVIEGISFVLLLIDYKFSETVALCEPLLQQSLSKLTFDGLMTTTEGAETARGLINNVINQQISQQISVDAISETLQQRCGSFCSAADVLLYKALESVRKSKESRDANEQRTCLKESFRLFRKCTSTLSLEKLQEVVSEYRALRYANGAVQLPLQCAKDWDADNHGRDYWQSERLSGDERREAYKLRKECYKLVTETLSVFDAAYEQSQGKEDGNTGDAEAVRKNAYQLALGSDDPMFHAELYDWLVSQGRTDDLLEIRTPYIEDHLIQQAQRNDKWGELLWQFFVHSGQYLRAAYALQALADSETDLDLESRIEYLSLAVSNAKSHPSSEYGQHETAVEFLSDLEDKLEVAQVQLEIANLLSRKYAIETDPEWRRRYDVLTSRLLDLSTLYREFAEPEDLNAMKLMILKVADRRDPQLVISIWEAILVEAGTPQAVQEQVSTLAMRFFPSEIAFPLDLVCKLLDEFAWSRRLPPTWAPSVLLSGGISFDAIFGALLAIHESSVPPYNDIARTNHVLAEITVLLETWLDEQTRPGVGSTRAEFPVNYLDEVVSEFILHARATEQQNETTTRLLDIQRRLRRRF